MDVKNTQHLDEPEELIEELKNNPNQKAWNVDPMRSPGYVVWYNSKGQCVSCMTVEDNRDSRWGKFSEFDKETAEYEKESKKITYGDRSYLSVDIRSDANLETEIEDNESISQLVNLKDTIVGEIYLESIK